MGVECVDDVVVSVCIVNIDVEEYGWLWWVLLERFVFDEVMINGWWIGRNLCGVGGLVVGVLVSL